MIESSNKEGQVIESCNKEGQVIESCNKEGQVIKSCIKKCNRKAKIGRPYNNHRKWRHYFYGIWKNNGKTTTNSGLHQG